jgi:hypothetical protein
MSMKDLHYQVANQKFFNKFQAADYAYNTNQKIFFKLFETAFDRADWSQEPKHSWDELLDIRARQIEAKGLPIILHFSGGTDSYTIYKVFERNNIHIDVLYFRPRNDPNLELLYNQVFEFLNKGIYDPFCKIIIESDVDGVDLLHESYHSEDWVWDTSQRYTFGVQGGNGVEHEKLCKMLGKDAISVAGYDKPRIHFETDGTPYSFQDDINYVRPMNCDGIDCFYINPELPELHIKQSYMLKNYLKTKFELNINSTPKEFNRANFQYNPQNMNWNEYATASGRFGDIANSHSQHLKGIQSQLIVPDSENYLDAVCSGVGERLFEALKGTITFKNYVTSMIAVRKGSVGKYFNLTGNDLHQIPIINSRYYQMTL